MTFDDITEDGRLWAVRYEKETDNELYKLFDRWNDVKWLRDFFKENLNDLESYFKIKDINIAIEHTIEDSEHLQCLIMDLSPRADLDEIFKPLHNDSAVDSTLEKEKARLNKRVKHVSWLRIYAIKLAPSVYIITGGAIKLTRTMQERKHTRQELDKLEKVRRFLLSESIIDDEGFVDYLAEL